MPQLRYDPGPDDPVPYHDTERHAKYYPSVHDVPREAVDEYLAEPGWERPSAEEFDAGQFIDRDWREVISDIKSGAVDDHLDAIHAAESDRGAGSGPRDSVMTALYERQDTVARRDS